jgi:hypothetical protein
MLFLEMRQKNSKNGISENIDREEESSRYLELQSSIISISEKEFEQLKLSLKISDKESSAPKKPEISYAKLLMGLREKKTMTEVKKNKISSKNLSDDLDYLEDILVKHFPLKHLDNKLLLLREAEAAFELNIRSKGFRLLEKLKKFLTKEDHWISWRILELSYQHYGANGKNKLASYSNLYQLSKHISYGFEDEDYIKSLKSDYEASSLGKFVYIFKNKRIDVLNEMSIRLEQIKELKDNLYNTSENPIDFELNKQIASIYVFEAFEFLHFCYKFEFWGKKNLKESAREIINDLFLNIFPYSFYGDNYLPNAKSYLDALFYENLRCFAIILNNKFDINIEDQPEIIFKPPVQEITTRLTLLKIVERISIISENVESLELSDIKSLKVNLDKLVGDNKFLETLSNENKLVLYGIYIISNDIIGFGPKRPPGKYNKIRMKLRNTKYEELIYNKSFSFTDTKEKLALFEMCLFKIKRIQKLLCST